MKNENKMTIKECVETLETLTRIKFKLSESSNEYKAIEKTILDLCAKISKYELKV